VSSPRWAVGVVADDLTGGAAIAGEFAARGTPTLVTRADTALDSTAAVVFDTGSRHLERTEAVRRVAAVTDRLRAETLLAMKKVDSGLLGNAAAELAVFAERWAAPVVLAPACPAVGWCTVAGQQVHERHASIDVAAVIAQVTGERPALLSLDVVRAGVGSVACRLCHDRATVTLADATTVEELAVVARGAVEAGVTGFAGTYGLGAALAPLIGSSSPASPRPAGEPANLVSAHAEHVLIIVGSAAEVACQQVEHLRRAGADEIAVNLCALLGGRGETETARIRRAVSACKEPLILVHTAVDAAHCERVQAADSGSVGHLAPVFAPTLAAAAEAAEAHTALFLVGGETAGTVVDRLGIHSLIVHAELAPGVPLAVTSDPNARLVITKPGAFGGPSTVTEMASRVLQLSLAAGGGRGL